MDLGIYDAFILLHARRAIEQAQRRKGEVCVRRNEEKDEEGEGEGRGGRRRRRRARANDRAMS